MVRIDCVNFDIKPELGALRFDDVNICPVNRAHAARGRLSIRLDLVRDEHCLFRGCHESCLPGKFGDQTPNAVMLSGVQPLGATCSMSPIRVEDVLTLFAPRPQLDLCPVHDSLIVG